MARIYPLKNGYKKLTVTDTAQDLAALWGGSLPPKSSTGRVTDSIIIICGDTKTSNTENVKWTADINAPTDTDGMPLIAGASIVMDNARDFIEKIQFIREGGTNAIIHVHLFEIEGGD